MTRFKIALLAAAAVACFSASSAFAWGHISKEVSVTEGAYVFGDNAVSPNSPAAKAGIEKGDIITKINDNQIGRSQGLSTIIGMYRPNTKVTITILRDGKTITKDVTLTAYQASGS